MKITSFASMAIALSCSNSLSVKAQPPDDERKECISNPDPHFRTFDGTYYDFHKGCTLVLVHVPNFLDVHINTFPTVGYSYIDKVGLRVMNDSVSIDASTGAGVPASLGGYPLTYAASGAQENYELSLDDGQYVRVTEWGGSFSVRVSGGASDFGDAVGMCGTWTAPGLIDRDGNALADGNDMGEEWKVDVALDDPFVGSSSTCDPAIPHGGSCEETGCLCDGGDGGQTRCKCFIEELGGCLCAAADGCVTQEEIEEACQDVEEGGPRDNCMFDVQTTGDVAFGKAPFYEDSPAPPVADGWCAQDVSHLKGKGGKGNGGVGRGVSKCQRIHEDAACVFNCRESDEFKCVPGLCHENNDAPADNEGTKDRCACKVPTRGLE